ncbi:MAG: NusA-like transcription termination signal-binding factor [Nitrososphaerota archaeon]|nr:NusA-like transcription termination signal-binding factor [Candidatus Bathyarchaeota archaeon]MCX8162299.1 NusA-like transcription termination signal-binding factor [Candidatus Bathyarchaeota archaeon]MDW8061085.1 NusA-like transcription termination signal-binding factor [Nitrososphaerota archaeon]
MPEIRFTKDEMQYITLLETVAQVECQDCIIDSERGRVIFIVKEGDVGKAIGKSGVNVKRLSQILGKSIEIVEYSGDPVKLLMNAFTPAKVKEIRIIERPSKGKIAIAIVEPRSKGLAIGRNGRNIDRVRKIAKRYFDIDHVVVREA